MNLKKNGNYVAYLRKSRKDAEYIADEDVLARHERLLRETAKRLGIMIADTYREVRSGDSISTRPLMQRLLSEVSDNQWDGVLVVEVERLARGDTIDQGLVSRAFQESSTLIITPSKTYDPNDEFDEEYFEFGLFMSRREYKTIKRRMQRGRVAASKEGKYCGNITPYGYARERAADGKGFRLIPDPTEAEAVRNIYEWYVNGIPQTDGYRIAAGSVMIADQLNSIGIRPRKNEKWSHNTVYDILKNPVYIGKITWGKCHDFDSVLPDGTIRARISHEIHTDCVYDGLHEALIPDSLYYAAQKKRQSSRNSKLNYKPTSSNALAGLVKCKYCGHNFYYRKAGSRSPRDTMLCGNRYCNNIGCFYSVLEERIINAIQKFADDHIEMQDLSSGKETLASAIKSKEKEQAQLASQLERVYSAFERGVYSDQLFLSRSQLLQSQIDAGKKELEELKHKQTSLLSLETKRKEIIPKMLRLIDLYWTVESPFERNQMLKEVLDHVEYEKKQKSPRGGSPDNFEIIIYPRIPLT